KAGASQPYLHLPELNQRNYQTVLLDKIDSAAAEGELHVYNFTAVTEKGEITTRSYIVEVSRTITFTKISLGNQNSTSTGSFFAAASGRVFGKTTPDSNAVLIDMVYYHSAQSGSPLFANGATLAAPADPTAQTAFTEITAWPVRNQTEFRELGNTLALFNDATTSAKIRAAFGTSPGSNSLTNLTTGTVFGFKTENGKYGIARVTLLTTPNVITNIGAIRLDVRVER
ncbi:MAG TPA: hypothetical protein VK927_11665, partial [Adhaeribacter sp.]|nr:hypothetical protein [Adhaeribacter sp.]